MNLMSRIILLCSILATLMQSCVGRLTTKTKLINVQFPGTKAFTQLRAVSPVVSDTLVTTLSFGAAYAWLEVWVQLANRGFDPKLSRKIIHSGSAPLFMMLWPLYSKNSSAKLIAAIVPFLQACRLIYAGRLKIKNDACVKRGDNQEVIDGGIVKAISRSGSRQEAIQGPLIYTIVLLTSTALYFRDSPIGNIIKYIVTTTLLQVYCYNHVMLLAFDILFIK